MTARTEQEPQVEDEAVQREWAELERIRRETAKPVPYVPDDRL